MVTTGSINMKKEERAKKRNELNTIKQQVAAQQQVAVNINQTLLKIREAPYTLLNRYST